MRNVWLGNVFNVRSLRWIVAVVLALQPIFFVVSPVARALPTSPDSIVINELSTATTPTWVELYNATAAPIDVTNWQLQNQAGQTQLLAGMASASGFLVIETAELLGPNDTIRLLDNEGNEVNVVSYGGDTSIASPGETQTAARTSDGGNSWAVGVPTPGTTNVPDVLAPTVPTDGRPHNVVVTTHTFDFTWQPSEDNQAAALRYQLRASTDSSQAGDMPDATSKAKYSTLFEANSLAFQSLEDAMDGKWYWQVRAVDGAGNQSAWSDTWQVLVDSHGPVVGIQQPNAGELFGGPNNQIINFTAMMKDDNGIASYDIRLDEVDKANVTFDEPLTQVSANDSYDTAQLIDGEHVLRLSSKDAYGNQGEQIKSFTVDKTPPQISPSVVEGQTLKGMVQLELTATEAHPLSYGITITDSGGVALKLEESSLGGESEEFFAANTFKYDWDTKKVSDGRYRVQFFGKDRAGHEALVVRTVTVDNVASGFGTVFPGQLNDPLLDQFSKQLAQPFPTPRIFDSFISTNVTENVDETTLDPSQIAVPETDRNAKTVAVAPSENGWRIFGVGWYWWLILMIALGLGHQRWRRIQQQPAVAEAL